MIRTYLLLYIWSSSRGALLKLSKTTSPQKLFPSDCITLYYWMGSPEPSKGPESLQNANSSTNGLVLPLTNNINDPTPLAFDIPCFWCLCYDF